MVTRRLEAKNTSVFNPPPPRPIEQRRVPLLDLPSPFVTMLTFKTNAALLRSLQLSSSDTVALDSSPLPAPTTAAPGLCCERVRAKNSRNPGSWQSASSTGARPITEQLRACRIARCSGSERVVVGGGGESALPSPGTAAAAGEVEAGVEDDASAGSDAAATTSINALCPPEEENAACGRNTGRAGGADVGVGA